MKEKLTVSKVKSLKLPKANPNEKFTEEFIWDEELACFGIKLTPTRATYVVQCRINGKNVKHVVGRTNEISLQEARLKATKALAQLRSGVDLNTEKVQKAKQDKAESVTLGQAYTDFKASRQLRPRTLETYDGTVKRCLSDWLDKPLTSITKDMIEKRHRQISSTDGVRGNREAVANSAMRILRTVFNYANATYEDAEGKSLLPENPVKRLSQIRAWNRIPRRQDIIQPDDLEAWYQGVMLLENTIVRDYLLVCLFTGLRRTETMKLKWRNVDYKKTNTLTIPGTDTKNHDTHQLPLSDFLIDHFKRMDKVRRIDNEYVFPAEEGPNHIVEPKRVIANVIEKSKVKFSLHTLRRTFETSAERLDLSYYALKRLLNHRITNDVTSGYIVTSVDRLKEPMQKITDYFKEKMKIKDGNAASQIQTG